MAYADYSFYTGTYKGTAIAQAAFDRLAARASAEMDMLTANRAAPIIEAATDTATIAFIKMATCAIAEEIQSVEAAPEVTSETVGRHSVTYLKGSYRPPRVRYADAARVYLGLTGLMFRGFDADQC